MHLFLTYFVDEVNKNLDKWQWCSHSTKYCINLIHVNVKHLTVLACKLKRNKKEYPKNQCWLIWLLFWIRSRFFSHQLYKTELFNMKLEKLKIKTRKNGKKIKIQKNETKKATKKKKKRQKNNCMVHWSMTTQIERWIESKNV